VPRAAGLGVHRAALDYGAIARAGLSDL